MVYTSNPTILDNESRDYGRFNPAYEVSPVSKRSKQNEVVYFGRLLHFDECVLYGQIPNALNLFDLFPGWKIKYKVFRDFSKLNTTKAMNRDL